MGHVHYNKMKNIFDYATKELSQDAFLCWLFENYECDNEVVKRVALGLLGDFNDIEIADGEISYLKTYRQLKKMDIVVRFVCNKQDYMTVIEDKTSSDVHDDQLQRYARRLERDDSLVEGNPKVSKVFYKTDEDNGTSIDDGWKEYYIDQICKLFEKYMSGAASSNSEILDGYYKHIIEIQKKTSDVSSEPLMCWDYYNFRTYFKKVIIPNSNVDGCEIVYPGWYGYPSVIIKRFLPEKSCCIELEVMAKEYYKSFSFLIRAKHIESTTNPNGTIKQIETPLKLRERKDLRDVLCKDSRLAGRVRRDWKWAIAGDSKMFDDKVQYTGSINYINEELCGLISHFASKAL